jgi:hypothetical protein
MTAPFPTNATMYSSPVAGEQAKVLKAGPGVLTYLRVSNTTAAKIYVFVANHVSDASSTPLMPPIPVPANDASELCIPCDIPFSAGLSLGSSTTQAAYAAAGANSLQIHAIYK